MGGGVILMGTVPYGTQTQIQAVNKKEIEKVVTQTEVGQMIALVDQNVSFTITPVANKLVKINSMALHFLGLFETAAMQGATSGTINIEIEGANILTEVVYAYNQSPLFAKGVWQNVLTSQTPSNETVMYKRIFESIFNFDYPITIRIKNRTDVDLTFTPYGTIAIEKETVVS